jgi:hypothetical protein
MEWRRDTGYLVPGAGSRQSSKAKEQSHLSRGPCWGGAPHISLSTFLLHFQEESRALRLALVPWLGQDGDCKDPTSLYKMNFLILSI